MTKRDDTLDRGGVLVLVVSFGTDVVAIRVPAGPVSTAMIAGSALVLGGVDLGALLRTD